MTAWAAGGQGGVWVLLGLALGSAAFGGWSWRRARLAEEEAEQLSTLFDLAHDLICIANVKQGRFVRVNRAFERVLGYSKREVLETPLMDFVHPEDREYTEAEATASFSEQPVLSFVNRYRARDGEWRWLSWNASQYRGDLSYAVARDLSSERTLEILRERNRELERSNKALDDFTYVASHDLRSPLRDIDRLSHWILQDALDALPEASAKHLKTLRGRVGRMERLLEDLLEYSRAGRADLRCEVFAVAELFEDVAREETVPEGFVLRFEATELTLDAPRAPLKQALLNLIRNAIQHHDRTAGHVDVSARAQDDDRVEFAVRDDGPGIEPRFHERVFRVFQSLSSRDKIDTSGMGLAIVQKFVEAHQGKVWLESPEGERGCTFRFTWPKRWAPQLETPLERAL